MFMGIVRAVPIPLGGGDVFGKPVLAYDVVYNRETTGNKACYFKTADELTELLNRNTPDGTPMKEIAMRRYTWKYIAEQYEILY